MAVVGALGVLAAVDAAGAGAGAAGAGAGFGAGGAAAALVAAPTVTIELIFSMVFFGTPALAKSATDVYRPSRNDLLRRGWSDAWQRYEVRLRRGVEVDDGRGRLRLSRLRGCGLAGEGRKRQRQHASRETTKVLFA